MKQLWNTGVITATFRRIKTLGIVAGIILLVQVTTSIVGVALMRAAVSDSDFTLTEIGVLDISLLVSAVPSVCMITAFLMTLIVFNYLNKKDKSDFFHALPHKRETMFVSMLTAIVLMVALIAVAAITVAIVLSLVLSIYPENIGTLLMIALNSIAGAFLVAATVGFVMSITGTTFSNIVVSIAVMFLPRALILLFSGVVSLALPDGLVPYSVFTGAISDYNVVSSTFIGFGIPTSISSFVYTTLLGAVFTVFGAVLYRKRKSEAAGISAPSRRLQAVYRMVIGFALYSVITAVLAGVYLSGGFKEDTTLSIYLFVVAYIFASILYFLFELISTRSWANVGRAAPGLGIVALASLLVFGGMTLAYNAELNYCPEAQEIESISFKYEEVEYDTTLSEYLGKDIADYPVYDQELIAVAREALADRIDRAKRNAIVYDDSSGYGTVYTLYFNTGSNQVERKVKIPSEYVGEIKEQYEKCLKKALKNSSVDLDSEDCTFYGNYSFTEDEEKALEQSAIAELSEMGTEEWMERETAFGNDYYPVYLEYIPPVEKASDTGSLNLITWFSSYARGGYIEIPVSLETLPKTYKMYIETIVEKASREDVDYTEFWEKFEDNCYVDYVFDNYGKMIYSDDYDYDESGYETACEIVQYRGVNRKVQDGDIFAIVSDYDSRLFAVPLENVTEEEISRMSNVPEYMYRAVESE